jgi:hypothetical protein
VPVVGLILTIAEGPTPFGFLFFASVPGFYFLDLLNRVLPLSRLNILIEMLLGVAVNIALYFIVGYLLDYAIARRRRSRSTVPP